jgi:hypothetical protein
LGTPLILRRVYDQTPGSILLYLFGRSRGSVNPCRPSEGHGTVTLHRFRTYLLLTSFLIESPMPSRLSSYMGNSLLIIDTVGWFQYARPSGLSQTQWVK